MTDYTWDYRNRLTDVQVKNSSGTVILEDSFRYDIFDRRIAKTEDPDGAGSAPAVTTWTVYDGANPYADLTGSIAAITTRYLYGAGIDSLLARMTASTLTMSAQVAWYLTDNLGSVRQFVDTSGTVKDAIAYDSFGNIVSETSPTDGDRFKYTAREWDGEIGLYYYRARYFAPGFGRFIGEDPSGFGGQDSDLYRYVLNMPDEAKDPTGLGLNIVAKTPALATEILNMLKQICPDCGIQGGAGATIAVSATTNKVPAGSKHQKGCYCIQQFLKPSSHDWTIKPAVDDPAIAGSKPSPTTLTESELAGTRLAPDTSMVVQPDLSPVTRHQRAIHLMVRAGPSSQQHRIHSINSRQLTARAFRCRFRM